MAKVDATRNYGAEVELVRRPASTSRSRRRRSSSTSTGATFVHAFEDERVIAGQGTIGLELAEQLPDLGTVVVPVGGGGLASGIAIALRELRPGVRLVGVQAAACAPFAGRHRARLHDRRRDRGQAARRADGRDPRRAARRDRHRQRRARSARRSCCCSSGRSSSSRAPARRRSRRCSPASVAGRRRGLRAPLGRQHRPDAADHGDAPRAHARGPLPRRPHAARRPPGRADQAALQLVAEERVNVVSVEHHREGMRAPSAQTEVELTLAMRDEEHCERPEIGPRRPGLPGARLQ